jgi:CRP/FNR family transcriptional regulator, anaerobic regulatory protein
MSTIAVEIALIPMKKFATVTRLPVAAPVERLPTPCSGCGLRDVCLPCGLTGADAQSIDELVYSRRRVRRHETLYRAGAPFQSLYAVRGGFFKSFVVTEDGREQVTGFQMPGEIIGLDGIETEAHRLNVVALEDSMICTIPFARLEQMAARLPALQRQIHRMMSREIVRDQGVMTLLGTMDAEQRVVAFLLSLSQRFAARGYAAGEFLLRMTREEIGSYLGLKLETVSRVFSRLQQAGLIGVRNKNVQLRDLPALKSVLSRAA